MKTLPATRQFKAGPCAGFNDEDARKYGTFLEKQVGLGRRAVGPSQIVDAARPSESPIHECFEWNDGAAAEEWRNQQARQLVSHIVVSREVEGEDRLVRAFHNVLEAGKSENALPTRGYVSDRVVWRKPELASQVVARAHAELRGWTDRYSAYASLSDLVSNVRQAVEEDTSEAV